MRHAEGHANSRKMSQFEVITAVAAKCTLLMILTSCTNDVSEEDIAKQ
jgi:hypothetical protein